MCCISSLACHCQANLPQSLLCFGSPVAQGLLVASHGLKPKLIMQIVRLTITWPPLSFQPPFPLFSPMQSVSSNPTIFKMQWGVCSPALLCTLHIHLCGGPVCPMKGSSQVAESTGCRGSLAEFGFCSFMHWCDLVPGYNNSRYLIGLL